MKDLHEYYRPGSIDEAVQIKQEHGARAAYMGGSTDLLVHRPPGVEVAIDIRRAGMSEARVTDAGLLVGGGCLLRDAEAAAQDVAGGMLRQAIRETAPWLIRNAATLAGNLANASPAADSVPALLALDAAIHLHAADGDSERRVEDVLVGPHVTSLGDALITAIGFRREVWNRRAAFIKLARSHSDIALVNVAVAFDRDGEYVHNVRIALGAVAPTTMRATRAEAALEGSVPTGDLVREAGRLAAEEVRPISDWRASEGYRRRMSDVLVRRALARALDTTHAGGAA